MLDLEPLYRLVSLLPFECLQAGFMQQALVALILLAPMAATMGVQVVSFRMAFFSDAISHSAFAGVALGLIFSINPHVAMPVFGILVGLGIMAVQRNSALSSDTIIGVFFSAVMAFGLAVVSRDNAVARDLQQFLYGDILTITETDIRWLIGLFFALAAFQIWGYNRLLYIGLNPVVAKAHRIKVFFWQYLFAGLLALVVMFSVWAVGVLLVTALLIVPAATARNLARTAGGMFSAVMAFGLAVVSRDNAVARDLQQFLYGDILTITETDIRWLIGLFFALAAFQIWGYNRLLYIGLNPVVAKAHRIKVFFWQYLFAGLLALVVMFSVWAVGVLLVTALLIVPAATARNLARTAGGMFWWSILVSVTSAVAGLVLSAQEWAGTATGATVVLVSCGWFLLSAVLAAIRGEGRRQ